MLQKIAHVSKGKKSDFFQIKCTSLINIWNVKVNTFFLLVLFTIMGETQKTVIIICIQS